MKIPSQGLCIQFALSVEVFVRQNDSLFHQLTQNRRQLFLDFTQICTILNLSKSKQSVLFYFGLIDERMNHSDKKSCNSKDCTSQLNSM